MIPFSVSAKQLCISARFGEARTRSQSAPEPIRTEFPNPFHAKNTHEKANLEEVATLSNILGKIKVKNKKKIQ